MWDIIVLFLFPSGTLLLGGELLLDLDDSFLLYLLYYKLLLIVVQFLPRL